MNRRFTGLIPIALVLAGCSGGKGGEQSGEGAANPRATPVIVQAVAYEPEQVRLEAVGTSRARKSVVLYPPSSGEVTAVNFDAGQRVDQADVLLELDARDEALAVKLARVRLEEAERLYRRYQRSQSSGAVTTSELDSARAAVETARLELHRAEVALEDRVLKAPFAGHVGVTDIDVGARVSEDTAVTTLDDRGVLLIRFEVPEVLIDRIGVGTSVTVSTWSDRKEPVTGRIADIDSRIDSESRTFVARAEVANPDDRLRPGMSFRVALAVSGPDYPVVPEVAVQWGGDGSFVWRVAEGKARRVPVTIVQRRVDRVLVRADLPEGAVVVEEGVQRMREGVAVAHQPFDGKSSVKSQ